MWEGGVAPRGCALLLSFPFFPPSRPSFPPSPSAQPAAHIQTSGIFLFYPATPLLIFFNYNLSPTVPLALFSILHHGLPPVNVPIVVGCHAALRSPPFWLDGHTGETFLVFCGAPRLPAGHLLCPASLLFLSVSVPLFLSSLCSRTSGSDRMVNSVSVAFHTEQVSLCRLAGGRPGLLGYCLISEGQLSQRAVVFISV